MRFESHFYLLSLESRFFTLAKTKKKPCIFHTVNGSHAFIKWVMMMPYHENKDKKIYIARLEKPFKKPFSLKCYNMLSSSAVILNCCIVVEIRCGVAFAKPFFFLHSKYHRHLNQSIRRAKLRDSHTSNNSLPSYDTLV